MSNFFDQPIPGEEEREALVPVSNFFDQTLPEEERATGNFFDDEEEEDEIIPWPEPEPEPEEELGTFGRAWGLAKKGGYDLISAWKTNKAKNEAQEYLRLKDEDWSRSYNPPSISAFGMPSVADLKLQNRVFAGDKEAQAEVASRQQAELEKRFKDVEESLAAAREWTERGEALNVDFSPVVKEFLENKDESTSWWDDMTAEGLGGFADIVLELGAQSAAASVAAVGGGIAGGAIAGPAGFAVGMGATSGKVEFAHRINQKMREAGFDPNSADATDMFITMVADEELMDRIVKEAAIEASVIAAVDTATGGLATKTFGSTLKSIVGREAVNLVAQSGIQMTGGAWGEWVAEGLSKGDWTFGREELAEALGELVMTPLDVGGAAISGVKDTRQAARDKKIQDGLDELAEIQKAAEEAALARGEDDLTAIAEGEEAAAAFAESILAELDQVEGVGMSLEDVAGMAAEEKTASVLRQYYEGVEGVEFELVEEKDGKATFKVYGDPDPNVPDGSTITIETKESAVQAERATRGAKPLTDADVATEVQTELEREQAQKEAAETYTSQTREALAKQKAEEQAYESREAEKAAAKEAEVREMEYEAEVEKGAGVAAIEEAGVEAEVEAGPRVRLNDEQRAALSARIAELKKQFPQKKQKKQLDAAIQEAKDKAMADARVQQPKPATSPMGEALRAAQQAAKAKKQKNLTGRRVLEAEKNKPALLEDKRPSVIVVDPEGASRPMTAAELDAQIRRRADIVEQQEMELEAGEAPRINIPVRVQGLNLNIETPKGTARGERIITDAHYGELEGTKGADGEALDVYVGEQDWRPSGQKVWVVNQYNQDGTFDEHKVMLGFGNEQEATAVYDQNKQEQMDRGEVVEMTMDEFKNWAQDGKTKTQPLAGQDVLQTGTMEDVLAAQERAAFKGRKKPKILYRVGEVEVVETDYDSAMAEAEAGVDVAGPGIIDSDRDATILQAKDEGKTVGTIISQQRGDVMQIAWTMVDLAMRGKRIGQQLLMSAIRTANKKGFELISDTSVSVAQLRVYESLRKKGQLVVEYSDPVAVAEILEKYKDDEKGFASLQLPAMQPVVKRMFIPAYTETIRLRKQEQLITDGYAFSEARNAISMLLDLLPGINPDNVFVVDSIYDLPTRYRQELIKGNHTLSPGFYDEATHQAYIILENNNSVKSVVETFLHEITAHMGLREVFGFENMDALLQEIYDNVDKKLLEKIKKRYYFLNPETHEGRMKLAEEIIAHLAENVPDSTLLTRVRDFIRNILRQIGMLNSWSEGDIQSLLRDVRRELGYTPLDQINLTTEAEIEETGEIVTLTQTAEVALRRHDKRVNVLERLRECVG